MRRTFRTLALATAPVAVLVASFAIASPGGATNYHPDPVPQMSFTYPLGQIQEDMLQVTATNGQTCDSNIATSDVTISQSGTPVSTNISAGWSTTQFRFTITSSLANAPGTVNSVDVHLQCNVSGTPISFNASVSWAQLEISKVVVGSPPIAAEFTLATTCGGTTFTQNVHEGGTRYILSSTATVCSITETVDNGATHVSISPSQVDLSAFETYRSTVTNEFPAAPSPDPVPAKFTG